MKKHLIVIGTAVLLVVVGLSGCTDSPTNNLSAEEEIMFIGIWAVEEPEDEVYNTTWTFYDNDTIKVTFDLQGQSFSYWGTYKIEDGKLHTTSQETTPPSESFDYEFYDVSRLILSYGEETIVFNKGNSKDDDITTGITMTTREYYEDQETDFDWTSYYTQLQNSLEDGDTLNIQDTVSLIKYWFEDDKTSITFTWQEGYNATSISFYFEGNITNEFNVDDEVKITVNIKHVTFSAIGYDWDMDLFEEQWVSEEYFSSHVDHWTNFENGLKPMSQSVIEKIG